MDMDNQNPLERINIKAIKKRIPLACHLDLTYKCNLNCLHCYVTEEDERELSTEEYKDIIEQLAQAGTLYLSLSGGEILTRKDFLEIAEHARELNFALKLSTNATLINQRMAKKIADLNPEQVNISIYSHQVPVHDHITQTPGSLYHTLQGAKLLAEENVKITIGCTILKENAKDYPQVGILAQELGAQFQLDPRITPRFNGNPLPLQYRVEDEKILYEIFSYTQSFSPERDILTELSYPQVMEDIICGAGFTLCYISPYGDLYPCIQYPLYCGNLRRESFKYIWENSPKILQVRRLRITHLTSCVNCELKNYCRYCPGIALLEEGSLDKAPQRCCREAKILKKMGEE